MIIHPALPKEIQHNSDFKKIDITYFSELFFIKCEINQNGVKDTKLYLFDTGYHKTVM